MYRPISTVDGSDDAVWRNGVHFGGCMHDKHNLGGKYPLKLYYKCPQYRKISVKMLMLKIFIIYIQYLN